MNRQLSSRLRLQTKIIGLIIFFFFIRIEISSAQKALISKKEFFAGTRVIEMTLVADYKKLIREKLKKVFDQNYQPATITCVFPGNIKVTEEVEIRARGIYRREECHMPPLMVNFKTSRSGTLKNLGRLKLVWPCGNGEYDEQLILKEFLAYKIFNLLTEKSFRVRLISMKYQDNNDKMKPQSFYAFFIEDVDDMAKRNKCIEVEPVRPHTESTNRKQATLVSLFEYMIGNSDWAIPIYHNVKLIRNKKDSLSAPFVVPYDLDYSGLVNARYAIPPESLPITSVRQRFYLGFPRTMEELQSALDIFRNKRKEMYALIQNFDPLSAQNKKEMIKYLDEFFEATEKERYVKDLFINNARRE
ncbi:MAG: hypothetical protein ACSLE0_17450 [Chitinophagaceae bacterium]